MGFDGPASITTNYVSIDGALIWCNKFDDKILDYRWCNPPDVDWKDTALDVEMMGDRVQELECSVFDIGKNKIYLRLFYSFNFQYHLFLNDKWKLLSK